ncbi:Nitric oxide reductase transcription regulator NorR2 [Halioglobus japonicus]|nr:Nitric oxide reductase transcription regulator NorR2 [Halioglobus japonicus]
MDILPFIDIVEDLNRDLTARQRYQRMLEILHRSYVERGTPCDAIALLKLEGDVLHPLAVIGLKREALARRFNIQEHPRLHAILQNRAVTRFEADSDLPDPYDGLVEDGRDQLHVHDCMGSTIYIDDKPWGVLTLDALSAGAFDHLDPMETRANIAAVAAAIKTSQHIEALELRAEHQHEITQRLIANDLKHEIIGRSAALQDMLNEIHTVAPTDLSVLITGETGVGKELVARNIHLSSQRAAQPLVQINCAALPENIVESELFGHLRGSFSGATQDRSGRFELADGGTLFLDEVGELSLSIQAKLLRALQSGEIQRIGSDRAITVDVRIIAATNRELQREVKEGRFRADLYHRLSVYPLPVPPLRDRKKDCILLAGYFLEKNQHQLGVSRLRLSAGASDQLERYDWPGNVRELEHLLSRAALRAIREQGRGSSIISIDEHHLGLQNGTGTGVAEPRAEGAPPGTDDAPVRSLRESVDAFQRRLIEEQLKHHNGKLAAVARSLKLDRSNLVRTMARLGMQEHLTKR